MNDDIVRLRSALWKIKNAASGAMNDFVNANYVLLPLEHERLTASLKLIREQLDSAQGLMYAVKVQEQR